MKQGFIIIFILFMVIGCATKKKVSAPWKTLPDLPPMARADNNGMLPVNDIRMYYAVFNKNGPDPVILLHGGLISSDDWSFEVPRLSKTHKVIIVDSRGRGRSTMSDQPLSYKLMASDVLQMMDQLKIQNASIVGWSDGGVIGLILAIQHPDRINKLFTYGTNYNVSGYKTEAPDSAMSARFMTRARENYHKFSPTPDSFPHLLKALGKMYSTEPDIKPADLKTIRAPTVIAGGQYEQFIKQEHFEELAKLIPGAKLVIIPNVSHGGPIQDPDAFHKAVINLLDH